MIFITKLVQLVVLAICARATVPAATNGLWISTIDQPCACMPSDIKYYGGEAPYTLAVVSGSDYNAVLATIGERTEAKTEAWVVSVKVDSAFAIRITDCKGNTAYSAARTVSTGNDSCASWSVMGSPGKDCKCSEPSPVPPPVQPLPPVAPSPPAVAPIPSPTVVIQPSPVACVVETPVPQDPIPVPQTTIYSTYIEPCHDCNAPPPPVVKTIIEPAPCHDCNQPGVPAPAEPCKENCGNVENQDAIIWAREKRMYVVYKREEEVLQQRDWTNPDPNPVGNPQYINGQAVDPCNSASSLAASLWPLLVVLILVMVL